VIDWLIANRGNYIEWPALNKIASGPPAEWNEHTRAILDYAHSRGVKVGIGIELYSHRMGYRLPDRWEEVFAEMFAPLGSEGAALAGIVTELVTLEHDALIEQRLAPYLAGRDVFIDGGDAAGIVAQPDRPSFAEVLGLDPTSRATFTSLVVERLEAFAAALASLHDRSGRSRPRIPVLPRCATVSP